MDAEMNAWRALYGQQRSATRTLAELSRVRARDRWRRAAELVSASIIVVSAAVYLASSSTSARLVGAALLAFLGVAGAQQWWATRGLERALFAAPADYARELADRNAREIRRLTPMWPWLGAIALAVLVDMDLVLGWSGAPASMGLASAVVAAEVVVLLAGFTWRARELGGLDLERRAIEALCLEQG